jgi:hypothetical protein
VQYAHVTQPLALWDVWTRVAALPVAFEPPSAGFVLDWRLLQTLRERGVQFATLTHAAGLSSTGDAALDARLPLDEPYHLPAATVQAIASTRRAGDRVIALGTTVTRALEHAASRPHGLRAGAGLASQRLGAHSRLRVVDAIVSGTHEPGSSHRELLRAFASDAVLGRVDAALQANGYLTHEFGDSVLIERADVRRREGMVIDQVAPRDHGAAAAPHLNSADRAAFKRPLSEAKGILDTALGLNDFGAPLLMMTTLPADGAFNPPSLEQFHQAIGLVERGSITRGERTVRSANRSVQSRDRCMLIPHERQQWRVMTKVSSWPCAIVLTGPPRFRPR